MSQEMRWNVQFGFLETVYSALIHRHYRHDWIICRRLRDSGQIVYDCGCGARKVEQFDAFGHSETHILIPDSRGALYNALDVIENETFCSEIMGLDRNGDRLRLLTEGH